MPSTLKTSAIPSSLTPENAVVSGGLESEDLSLREAIRVVRKRKRVVLWSVLVVGLLTLLISSILRPYYSATATIEIEPQQKDLSGGSMGELASSLIGTDDVKTQIQTEVSVLQSDELEIETIEGSGYEDHLKAQKSLFGRFERAPEEQGLPLSQAPRAREFLLREFVRHLTITPILETRLIQVTFEDPDAKFAAFAANALVEQYVQDRLRRRNASTVQATGWMAGEIDDLNKQVQASEQKLIDYQRQSGLIVLPSGTTSSQSGSSGPAVTSPVLDRLTQMNSSLVAAEAYRINQEALYRLAVAGDVDALASMATSSQASGGGGGDRGIFEGLFALRQQENTLKLQLASESQTYAAKNPHLLDLDTQLKTVHDQIQIELKRIVSTTEMNYRVAKQAEDGIRAAYDAEEQKAYKMNDSEIRLAVLQQEADSSRTLYQDLYTKLQESKLSEGIQSSNIAVISRALQPSGPLHPKKLLNTLIGITAGLVLGVIVAFLFDALDDSISTSSEAERLTGKPVLAVIPLFNSSKNPLTGKFTPGFVTNRADNSRVARVNSQQASEAYRAFRTTILLSQAGAPPRTLMIASALPNEGKSTTCYELGSCFAILGNRVLLVDADLRKPTLHRKAGIPGTPGLSNLLTSNSNPAEAVFEDGNIKNLFILPAGAIPPNPSELLGSKLFDALLKNLSAQYDLVLIDTPPAMVVADAFVISAKVDGTVVVLRSGSTTRSVLRRVAESFHRNNGNVLGLLLNAVNMQSPEYYYDQGYYGRDYPSEGEGGKRDA